MEKYLEHFGQGHRACIGKIQALIAMWKAAVAILRRYELVHAEGSGAETSLQEFDIDGNGLAEIRGPLYVKVRNKIVD